jgi:hypothetical protein
MIIDMITGFIIGVLVVGAVIYATYRGIKGFLDNLK